MTAVAPERPVREEFARVGRKNQLYTANGSRLVAGGVILNDDKTKVLMISSASHPERWILPKGGIELDEKQSFQTAALRECWEEAGVDCRVKEYLGKIDDTRTKQALEQLEQNASEHPELVLNDSNPDKMIIPKTEFHFYEMVVIKIYTEWPEQSKRQRQWCDYSTCKLELLKTKRPEQLIALERSSIKR